MKINFSVRKFWELCEKVPNTVVIFKTENGTILGGYEPLSLSKYSYPINLCVKLQNKENKLIFVFPFQLKNFFHNNHKANPPYTDRRLYDYDNDDENS